MTAVTALSISELLGQAADHLSAAKIDRPRHEARILLAAVLKRRPLDLICHPQRTVGSQQQNHFWHYIQQRCCRRSLGHILGRREFWSLEFRLTSPALEPRPDSECLVAAAVAHLSAYQAPRLLDLGVGSGCLLLSVLHEVPSAFGLGIDRDPALCRLARDNARRLGLAARTRWIVADWLTACNASFDAILANPPYIPESEIAELMPEVAVYESRAALDGGVDGLACYRRLLPMIAGHLKPGGYCFLEIGHDQRSRVVEIAGQSGLGLVQKICDLGGQDRCLILSTGSEILSGLKRSNPQKCQISKKSEKSLGKSHQPAILD